MSAALLDLTHRGVDPFAASSGRQALAFRELSRHVENARRRNGPDAGGDREAQALERRRLSNG